jgi:hypothetical protein
MTPGLDFEVARFVGVYGWMEGIEFFRSGVEEKLWHGTELAWTLGF